MRRSLVTRLTVFVVTALMVSVVGHAQRPDSRASTTDPRRRAWVACPACRHGDGCPDCESGRNCFVHWQYLIRNEGPRVFLQCPTCAHWWIADTSHSDWRATASTVLHRKRA